MCAIFLLGELVCLAVIGKKRRLDRTRGIMCEQLESTLSRLLVPDNDVIRQVVKWLFHICLTCCNSN